MTKNLKRAYRTIMDDHFPKRMEISFVFDDTRSTLIYEKVTWVVDGVRKGLRYGENPGQEAALYKLINGNLVLGNVTTIVPDGHLVSEAELLQAGKHPGKINLTDADNALNILGGIGRCLPDRPAVAIMKHNCPSGVAVSQTIADAYVKADLADHLAAFGGCVALNRPVDLPTAEAIAERYAEVVVAPAYEEGTVAVLAQRENLRVMRIQNMNRLERISAARFVDFTSLIDGSIVTQLSYAPEIQGTEDLAPAEAVHDGEISRISRAPTEREAEDMLFGWLVAAGVVSNSILFVKDLVTVGIGAGEQDRVGAARIARDKAYRKMADRLAFQRRGVVFDAMDEETVRNEIWEEVEAQHGGLIGAAMVSDGFFPFRDGVDVGLREGVTAVIQPGGSLNDHEVIEACNDAGATMSFTGQRGFRH